MPAARPAAIYGAYHGSLVIPAHELLTIIGRRSARGSLPSRRVGASIHWALLNRSASLQKVLSQPCAAIQRVSGATPITARFSPAAPASVPIVCVPWPF